MDKQQILDTIANAPGCIVGQHVGDGWTATVSTWTYNYVYHITNLHTLTGKYPTMIGGAFGSGDTTYGGTLQWNIEKLVPLLIAFHNQGGLIQVDCHHYNPWTNGSYGTARGGPWSDLTTPGKPACTNWHTQLDTIHAGLLALNRAGIVPLWRPFPEMTHADGAWWRIGPGWWTSEQADIQAGFIAAWRDMWTRFADLDLIWVYGAANNTPSIACDAVWPGAEYVDVAGLSLYRSVQDANTDLAVSQLKSQNKPFVFSEAGCRPSNGTADMMVYLEQIKRYGAKYALFWTSWDNLYGKMAIVDQQHATEFMNDPYIITLDELTPAPVDLSAQIADLRGVATSLDTISDRLSGLEHSDIAALLVENVITMNGVITQLEAV